MLIVGCSACCAQYGLQESLKTNELALPIHHLYSAILHTPPRAQRTVAEGGEPVEILVAELPLRITTEFSMDIDVHLGGILTL